MYHGHWTWPDYRRVGTPTSSKARKLAKAVTSFDNNILGPYSIFGMVVKTTRISMSGAILVADQLQVKAEFHRSHSEHRARLPRLNQIGGCDLSDGQTYQVSVQRCENAGQACPRRWLGSPDRRLAMVCSTCRISFGRRVRLWTGGFVIRRGSVESEAWRSAAMGTGQRLRDLPTVAGLVVAPGQPAWTKNQNKTAQKLRNREMRE